MSLAQVRLQRSEFDQIYHHVTSFYPEHRNMHARRSLYRKQGDEKKLVQIYLHMIHAPPGAARVLEGKISGKGVYWHYEIRARSGRPQLTVMKEVADAKARQGLAKRFTREIQARISSELGFAQLLAERDPNEKWGPQHTPGHYYLKRALPGMSATHDNCQTAVAAGFDQRFVNSLSDWNLMLLRG